MSIKNNKPAPANPRAVQWCYTLNNPTQPIEFNPTTMEFLVYGEEVGENDTFHHQGFIVFKNRKSLTNLKEISHRAHWETTRGTTSQAADYCRKDGKFHEFGTQPVDKQIKGGQSQIDKWRRISDLAKEGDLETLDAEQPKAFVGSYRNLKQLKVDYMKQKKDLDTVCGVWYYGESGAGKSHRARADFPDSYPKAANKWWDGYQQEEFVLCDDVDKYHVVLGHHFKIWSDKYTFLGETKGGTLVCRPQKFVVTSQYSISEIWEDRETREALRRRFKEIKVLRSSWDNAITRANKKAEEKKTLEAAKALNESLKKKNEEMTPARVEKLPKRLRPANIYFQDKAPAWKSKVNRDVDHIDGDEPVRKKSKIDDDDFTPEDDVVIVDERKIPSLSELYGVEEIEDSDVEDNVVEAPKTPEIEEIMEVHKPIMTERERFLKELYDRVEKQRGYVNDEDYQTCRGLSSLERPGKFYPVPLEILPKYHQLWLSYNDENRNLMISGDLKKFEAEHIKIATSKVPAVSTPVSQERERLLKRLPQQNIVMLKRARGFPIDRLRKYVEDYGRRISPEACRIAVSMANGIIQQKKVPVVEESQFKKIDFVEKKEEKLLDFEEEIPADTDEAMDEAGGVEGAFSPTSVLESNEIDLK